MTSLKKLVCNIKIILNKIIPYLKLTLTVFDELSKVSEVYLTYFINIISYFIDRIRSSP
jgi:hypothetical protein